jgi:Transposase Tn5 dimerisation domain
VVRWIAQLGGSLNRKSDGPPGVTVLWKGFQQLVEITAMYQSMRPQSLAASYVHQNKNFG